MMMKLRALCALLSLLPLCSLRAQTRPLVDHHQHLFSPAVVALVAPKPLPPVALPPELDSLVRIFERAARDSSLVRELYTEDAWLTDSSGATWVRGRDAIAVWWADARSTPFRLTPVGWSA